MSFHYKKSARCGPYVSLGFNAHWLISTVQWDEFPCKGLAVYVEEWSLFLSELCTNSASWCSTVCTVKRLSTSWSCASQSQVSHHGNIFALLPSGSWSYRVTSSAPMADGLSVWQVRRSGIPCRTTCVTRLLAGTVSDDL